MDLISNAYIAAFLLGAVHAIEVDHMVAVSVFTALKPRFNAAVGYGARWGAGHGLVVVVVGAALAWFEVKVPAGAVSWGEVLVGVALICLGIWAWRRSKTFHAHLPLEHFPALDMGADSERERVVHGHLHAHNGESAHVHGHGYPGHEHKHASNAHKHHRHLPTAMGALHGLAGSAPVLALIPITLLDDFRQALVYLLFFSAGTTLSMMIYACLAALAMHHLSISRQRVVQLTMAIALATIMVGVWWVISALFLR